MGDQSRPTSTYSHDSYGGYTDQSQQQQQQPPSSSYNNMGFYTPPGQPQQQGANNNNPPFLGQQQQYGGQQFGAQQQQFGGQQQGGGVGGAGFAPNILGNLDSDVARQIGLTYGSQAFQAGHDYLNTNVRMKSFSLSNKSHPRSLCLILFLERDQCCCQGAYEFLFFLFSSFSFLLSFYLVCGEIDQEVRGRPDAQVLL